MRKSLFLSAILMLGGGSELLAQGECSKGAARGVYAATHEGWVDPSTIFPASEEAPPEASMPVPFRGVSRVVLDGRGGGSGQITASIGGVVMTLQYVNLRTEVNPDCSGVAAFALGGPGLPGPIFQQEQACVVTLLGEEIVCTLASPAGNATNTTLKRIGRPAVLF